MTYRSLHILSAYSRVYSIFCTKCIYVSLLSCIYCRSWVPIAEFHFIVIKYKCVCFLRSNKPTSLFVMYRVILYLNYSVKPALSVNSHQLPNQYSMLPTTFRGCHYFQRCTNTHKVHIFVCVWGPSSSVLLIVPAKTISRNEWMSSRDSLAQTWY